MWNTVAYHKSYAQTTLEVTIDLAIKKKEIRTSETRTRFLWQLRVYSIIKSKTVENYWNLYWIWIGWWPDKRQRYYVNESIFNFNNFQCIFSDGNFIRRWTLCNCWQTFRFCVFWMRCHGLYLKLLSLHAQCQTDQIVVQKLVITCVHNEQKV